MLDNLISMIAPHHCYGCGKIGATLCDSCKYDIANEPYSGCIECGRLALRGICTVCQDAYTDAWCVGERDDILKRLIDGYKFSRQQASYLAAAELLAMVVPRLPRETIVTAIPTVSSHIRQRGYDHTALIAKEFARIRSLRYVPLLSRTHALRQRGATRTQRLSQAASAFVAEKLPDETVPYLLFDDIVTTGATIRHGAKTLQRAGAKQIMVAAVARQPLK